MSTTHQTGRVGTEYPAYEFRRAWVRLRARLGAGDRVGGLLAITVLAQAIWVASLTASGWFYQDDFTFQAQAAGRSFGWRYLSQPVNSHLTPGLRLQFFLLQRFAPFDHPLTIVVRVVLQAVATLLLARVVIALAGRRLGVVAVVACYAFSPLLVPGILWYAASTNLLPAQIFAALAVLNHVRWTRNGTLRHAAWTGLSLLAVAVFWEKTLTIALILPLLSLGYLYPGSLRRRLATAARDVVGWLLVAAPPAVFVMYFVLNGYGSGAVTPRPATIAGQAWQEWFYSIGPSLFGGPWRWFSYGTSYQSFSSAPLALELVAAGCMLVLIGIGLRRTGPVSLVAWSMPVVTITVGMALVSAGRLAGLGPIITRAYTYAFDSAFVLALAVTLALMAGPTQSPEPDVPPVARARQPSPRTPPRPGPAARPSVSRGRGRDVRPVRAVVAVAVAVVVVGSGISSVAYAARWHDNPSSAWVNEVRSQLSGRPETNLWNTKMPEAVLSVISKRHRVSDVLAVLQLHARYQAGDSAPELIDESGRVVPARLLPLAAARTTGSNALCNDLVAGVMTRTQPLTNQLDANEYFLHVEYFQTSPSVVRISAVGAGGRRIEPLGGSRVVLRDRLGSLDLALPFGTPRAFRIESQSPATNLCLTNVEVGYPFPSRGK